MKTRLLVGFHN